MLRSVANHWALSINHYSATAWSNKEYFSAAIVYLPPPGLPVDGFSFVALNLEMDHAVRSGTYSALQSDVEKFSFLVTKISP
jgi:hypothetical protein